MKKIVTKTSFFPEREVLHKMLRSSLAIFLISLGLTGCKKDDPSEESTDPPVEVVDTDISPLTQKLINGTQIITKFKSDIFTQITDGVSQTQISFLNKLGFPVKMFILEVDLKNPKLGVQALLPYNDYLNAVQTLSEMCRDNQKPGKSIIAAVNGDFFSAAGLPDGWFYVDGVALKTARAAASKCYFAVLKDKTPIIGGVDPVTNIEVPGIVLTNIQHAVSGRQWLVRNGVLAPTAVDVAITARTAIGYTTANVVYAIIVDGNQPDYSVGLGTDDVGRMMVALGTTRAINLSGGTSSTLVVKTAGQSNWMMQNLQPKKLEYLVANGIGFVINE